MKLRIYIENNGRELHVGNITGTNAINASFEYSDEYISGGHRGISISLPADKRRFSPTETKNYFEGLLPEGFTRRTVAQWIHADEQDYLTILSALGKECLGAIRIIDSDNAFVSERFYEPLTVEQVKALAAEGTSKSTELVTKSHLSLTGASGKVGLYYNKETDKWYLPLGTAPSTHIVKQSHIRLESIVCNEQLALRTADKLGIEVVKSFIVNTGRNSDNEVLLAAERYDRLFLSDKKTHDGLSIPFRLHQEDFAQCMGIPSSEKYETYGKHYMKSMFDILRMYSSNPIDDQLKLWNIIVFNYFIGNTDGHIKNFSLLYSRDMSSVRLAPAYDLLSTLVYEGSTRNMAFAIGGEYNIEKISRDHFCKAAKEIGISERIALQQFDMIKSNFTMALDAAADELIESGFLKVKDIKQKIKSRFDVY